MRFFPVLVVATGLVLAGLILAPRTDKGSPQDATQDDPTGMLGYSHRPGMVTHARYTLLTFPWPSRRDSWIDFDNGRVRSWIVQTTDAWDNPFVCTSILVDGEYYACLPSTKAVANSGAAAPIAFGLVASISSHIVGDARTTEGDFANLPVTKYRWKVSNPRILESEGFSYCDGEVVPTFYYELQKDESGIPIVETLGADCDGTDNALGAVLYHEIEFLRPDSLPLGFFDPQVVADELIARHFSPLRERFGKVYWLGFESSGYYLFDIDQCPESQDCVYLNYTAPSEERPDLSLKIGADVVFCRNEEALESELPDAKLCSVPSNTDDSVTYSAYWSLADGYFARLSSDELVEQSRDDFLAILNNVRAYEGPSDQQPPFLTEEAVRLLVADSLEVVCPSQLQTIREVRDSADFEYDAALREWYGDFGPLGHFTVNDVEPVVIPEGKGGDDSGNYPIMHADCVKNEEREAE
jgi:hypothetical protein